MKRRDVIKRLTLLPIAGTILPMPSLFASPADGNHLASPLQTKPMPPLHREAFVMDGHVHVMTRELLRKTDIGQRYPDGTSPVSAALAQVLGQP